MRNLACVNFWKYSVVSNREEAEEDAEGKRCAEVLRRLLEQKKVQNVLRFLFLTQIPFFQNMVCIYQKKTDHNT